MKKIFNYFGLALAIALMGACTPKEEYGTADVGLGIKAFFPTKVVTGQPMTINGPGLADVKEIVFPNGVSVTNFQVVSQDMIRVNAPAGISAEGGPIKVRTADDEAESRMSLTVGQTVVSGFSKQDGEEIGGGEQLTVYGKDLEFISSVELLDTDGNPLILQDKDFYRKGTSSVIFTIPKKTIFDGAFVGYLHTIDGRVIPLPELTYVPASDGGHWETVKEIIWANDDPAGHGAVGWSGQYRFSNEEAVTGEEIYAIPMDIWERMKTETFYITVQAEDPQIRVTTGWWSVTWTGIDYQPGNELLTDNGDGTWTLKIDLAGDPILDAMDVQHLLFTGDRFTLMEIYFETQQWVDGGGHEEIVKSYVWQNDDPAGHGAVGWSGQYRFSNEEAVTGEEIYAIPMDIWEKMKTETFYITVQGEDPQIRVTTGWWSVTWTGIDYQPGNELLTDNGDGTWTLKIDLAGDPILDAIDVQHLLFTGDRYTLLDIYFEETIWVDGGDDGPKEVTIWENDGTHGEINWSSEYRFANEEAVTGEEIYAVPMDLWNKMKSGKFYLKYSGDSYQIRVTTGWWSVTWTGNDFGNWDESDLITNNGDGTYTLEVNLEGDPILNSIDVEHLLFTGGGYTPLKLFLLEE